MKRLLLILILAGGCGVVALGWSARNPLSGKPKRLCVILSGSQERKAAAHWEAGRGTRSVASQRNVLADSNGEAHRKCRLGQSGVCHPCRAAIARDPVGQRAQAQDCKRPNGQREIRPAISQDMTPKAAIRPLDKAQRDVPRKPSTNTAASAAGDALWAAICRVESDCNPQAYNQSEQAAGIAQIRPIALRDCNRIVGENCWTLADRYDVAKSRAMFDVYTGHYLRHYGLSGPEATARIWNGGGNGWQKQATVTYWVKVRVALERN